MPGTRTELRPLPMRITQMQYDRLQRARDRDGLSIQEHVRRGLDIYLDGIEAKTAPKTVVSVPPATPPRITPPMRVRTR